MRYFLVFCLLIGSTLLVKGQFTYTTVASGAYETDATWGGPLLKPPKSGNCNCKIIITGGTTLNINTTINIATASIVLPDANSVITITGNNTITLTGISSFDLRNTQASIILNHTQNRIFLGGQEIYRTSFPGINSSTAGRINGLASASSSSARPSPNFINSVLPVKLSEFKVVGKNHKVNLSWTTEVEINSDRFEIERSVDTKVWNVLGSVSAAGNVSVARHYTFTDDAPLQGENYYRLRAVDIDAKFEYSPIKSVNIDIRNLNLNASPNPASSVLNISFTQPSLSDFQVKVINRSGQVVYNRKFAATASRIPLLVSNYPEGSYFIEVTDAIGNRIVKAVLIARR